MCSKNKSEILNSLRCASRNFMLILIPCIKLGIYSMIIWYTVSFLTQTTLCYYDIKDALQVDPDHQEAKAMMVKMEKRAQDNKREAMQLNLMGKHREALQKISIAIDTDPIIADFHVLRYEVVLRKNIIRYIPLCFLIWAWFGQSY